MEHRFGTDAALGVCFCTDDGQDLTLAQFEAMQAELGDKMPGCQSFFPDGSSAVCCTNYAYQIYRGLPGRVQVFGFANEDNPSSRVAREQIHPGGHDFAVVDERYLVDPWLRLVAGESADKIVFDMQDSDDTRLAVDIYGPRDCWTSMPVPERVL